MKKYIHLIIVLIATIILFGCNNEDYIIGGEANETNKLDMTTFDLLSRMKETEVVAELFERAGLKEAINGDITVVAPNIWSVNRYLRRRNNQALRTNPEAEPITIDDITSEELTKMGMYILPGKWWRETIPEDGKILTALDGTEVYISRDKTNTDPGAAWDGSGVAGWGYQYSNFMQEVPYIIHIHFKRGANWEWTGIERSSLSEYFDNPECDHVYRMYVSDILTLNGVVHVLYQGDYNYSDHYYYHSLFFFGTRSDDLL
ncbi:putative membrane protein [Proteiniphilum saccharofermentans]|uniref:Putative membrane protein n=1 Tax=Proteiniphilum saccharofermentans TaxID=1642647 RepID=A0A1R3TBG3_9BACT|nr:hypothetical protein [Proteiniphilum saccharofermentans]SCD21947.1 putative membrane protein [Proteiniphilum saccharofermentans]